MSTSPSRSEEGRPARGLLRSWTGRLLPLFLNTVYLGTIEGQAVNGLAGGARVFFGREFAALSWDQYLALLGCFAAPDASNPIVNPGESARQVEALKARLSSLGIEPDAPPEEASP